jgi:hypothetical protein
MKIKINKLPEAKTGGFFYMPYAGVLSNNPFGLIQSDTKNLDKTYNDSIKAIDKEKANLEAEAGEVLFKFDAGGVFKILGKKHSKGGTPLKADAGDFIFSNDKYLAINEKEAEVFDLKYSKRGKHLNTPANILKKEIDVKAYNKFLVTLNDPKADLIAKTTAQIMLGKYMEKLGQLGYLQESKKNFPQGMPQFAQGTAPVHADEIVDAEDKSLMFAKKGGTYLPKAQRGYINPYAAEAAKRLKEEAEAQGKKQSPRKDRTIGKLPPYPDQWKNYYDVNQKQQYSAPNWITPKDFYAIPGMIDYMKGLDVLSGVDNDLGKPDDARWGYRHNLALNKFFPNGNPNLRIDVAPPKRITEDQVEYPVEPAVPNEPMPIVNRRPNQFDNVPTVPFQGFDIGMTPAEVLSGVMPGLTALATPTQYDMLSQIYTPPIRLDRVNDTAEINAAQQSSALAQREMFANMDSGIAALASSDVRAREAQTIGQTRGRTNQINTGISNQEDSTNFQVQDRNNMFNTQQIHQTYNNNVLATQRKNEMLANGMNQSIGNFLAIENNINTLEQQATAAVIPYLSNVDTIDENGNPIRVQVPPIAFNERRMPIPTGYGSLDSVGVRNAAMTPDSGDYKAAYEYFLAKGVSPDKAAQAATVIFYGRQGQKNAASFQPTNPYAAMMQGLYNFKP